MVTEGEVRQKWIDNSVKGALNVIVLALLSIDFLLIWLNYDVSTPVKIGLIAFLAVLLKVSGTISLLQVYFKERAMFALSTKALYLNFALGALTLVFVTLSAASFLSNSRIKAALNDASYIKASNAYEQAVKNLADVRAGLSVSESVLEEAERKRQHLLSQKQDMESQGEIVYQEELENYKARLANFMATATVSWGHGDFTLNQVMTPDCKMKKLFRKGAQLGCAKLNEWKQQNKEPKLTDSIVIGEYERINAELAEIEKKYKTYLSLKYAKNQVSTSLATKLELEADLKRNSEEYAVILVKYRPENLTVQQAEFIYPLIILMLFHLVRLYLQESVYSVGIKDRDDIRQDNNIHNLISKLLHSKENRKRNIMLATIIMGLAGFVASIAITNVFVSVFMTVILMLIVFLFLDNYRLKPAEHNKTEQDGNKTEQDGNVTEQDGNVTEQDENTKKQNIGTVEVPVTKGKTANQRFKDVSEILRETLTPKHNPIVATVSSENKTTARKQEITQIGFIQEQPPKNVTDNRFYYHRFVALIRAGYRQNAAIELINREFEINLNRAAGTTYKRRALNEGQLTQEDFDRATITCRNL